MEDLDKPGSVAAKVGDAQKALGEAAEKGRSHLLRPLCCPCHHGTNELHGPRAEGSVRRMGPHTELRLVDRMLAAQFTELPPEKVQIHTTLLGCGLGRRAAPDFVIEAVVASKIAGKPVKVIWTREEDIKYDMFRAATCSANSGRSGQLRASLISWSHKAIAGSIMKDIDPKGINNGVDIIACGASWMFPMPRTGTTESCTKYRISILNS